MLKFNKIVIIIALISFIPSFLNSANSEFAGTTTSKLMDIETDPVVNALGGAYCAYVSDICGYEQNIAGIAGLNEKQLILTYLDWLQDTSIQYIAFGIPLTGIPFAKDIVFVTSFKFLNVPGFANKNDWGEDFGVINVSDYIFSMGFARKHNENLKYGLNFKKNRQSYSLNNDQLLQMSSLGIDLGVQYRWDAIKIPFVKKKDAYIYNLRFGFSIQNIDLNSFPDPLPTKIKLGLAYPFLYNCLAVFDINKDFYKLKSLGDSDYKLNLGLEYKIKNMISIRAGLKFGYNESAFTIGAGFQKQFGSILTTLNYSLSAHEELGYLNNVSLNTRFEKISFQTPLSQSQKKLVEFHYYRGMSLFVQDEIEAAIKEWEEVLKIDPGNPNAQKRIKEAGKIVKERKKIE